MAIDRFSAAVEFVNRRWFEQTGSYPDPDECAAVVLTVEALFEFHGLHCEGAHLVDYHPRVPRARRPTPAA